MSEDVGRPDWLVPGAEVATIRTSLRGSPFITKTRIKKIATKTFSIEGSPARFRISDQTYYERDTWSGAATKVVPLDSAEAQEAFSWAQYRRLENLAAQAVETWRRERCEQNRVAAIEALQALAPEDES
jgi:hypothetical protein